MGSVEKLSERKWTSMGCTRKEIQRLTYPKGICNVIGYDGLDTNSSLPPPYKSVVKSALFTEVVL